MAAVRKLASRPPEAVQLTKALLKANGRRALDAAIASERQNFSERLDSVEFEAAYNAFKTRSKG
jgi:enoyl-CoA hydratase/carnithine racemase